MEMTRLAQKKMDILLQDSCRNKFELKYTSKVMYENLPYKWGGIPCTEKILEIITNRAKQYEMTIIGVESSLDDDTPFYVFNYEHYENEFNPWDWVEFALTPIVRKHPNIILKFYIDIPEERLEVLSLITGIPY